MKLRINHGNKTMGMLVGVGLLWIVLIVELQKLFNGTDTLYQINDLSVANIIFLAIVVIILLCILLKSQGKIKLLSNEIGERHKDIKVLEEKLNRHEEALLQQISEFQIAKLEHLKVEDKLQQERKMLNNILDGSNIIICIWDLTGNVLKINRYTEIVTGYTLEDFKGRRWIDHWIPESDLEKAEIIYQRIIQGISVRNVENQILCKDGRKIDVIWNNNILYDENIPSAVVSMGTDITEHKRAEEKIFHMAYYDTLTMLPNRVLLEEAFNEATHNHDQMALLYFDLDNFKVVNDTLGHIHGDELLKDITSDLLKIKGENEILARLGGDEFALLVKNRGGIAELEAKAKGIISALEKNWVVSSQEFFISLSIGIALYPEHGSTYQTLLKNADTAMYAVKNKGKGCYELFEKTMADKILKEIEIEKSLRYGIKNKEFVLYYQPQYDLKTNRITGVEALIRWDHPFKGMIAPYNFIPIAERTGLIREIGRWVIYEACRQSQEWVRAGLSPAKVSLNLSAIQMKDKNFIDDIKAILKETGADAGNIEFEITEHAAIENFDIIIDLLNQLKEMKFKIALDDFGTGYSSLNYLKRLPIDYIKIDRSFVENVTANYKEQAITKSLIMLAQEMNIKIIAEGIETEEQREFLRNVDCNEGQGFLFGRPVPVREIEIQLKKVS